MTRQWLLAFLLALGATSTRAAGPTIAIDTTSASGQVSPLFYGLRLPAAVVTGGPGDPVPGPLDLRLGTREHRRLEPQEFAQDTSEWLPSWQASP